MIRFEDGDDSLVEVFLEVMEDRFPHFQFLKFKLVYDLKKRTKPHQKLNTFHRMKKRQKGMIIFYL